jgi:choline dehydrogenase-like flavoprotein
VSTLRGGACMLAHSLVDESGRNPFWPAYGYPGPVVAPPQDPPHITPYVPSDGEVLEADVVVVGSGAGGGTLAGVLAAQGRSVVVLEAGIATSERDYRQLEVEASTTMMYRNGLSVSADGNIGLLAGATLGGGTTVNWHNCVKPSAEVRREWAEHGLADVDTPEFDRHLEAVLARMSATPTAPTTTGRTSAWPRAPRRSAGRCTPPCATSTPRPTTRRPPASRSSATRAAASAARCRPTCATRTTPARASSPAPAPTG